MLALAGSGSTTWAGGRDQKLVGRAGQTVAVSGCPLSSMSPPPQAGSEGREKPCPTRPGPTRPGPGPPPSPHPLSRPLFHPDSLPGPGCSWLPSPCQGPRLPGGERQRQGQGGPRRAEAGCWAGGQPGGGGLRVPVITPPEGLGGGAGRTPNPNTCKTHARTQAHAHRQALGGGGRREATIALPFPPPGADDVPRLQNLPRVERGAQWPCNSAVQLAPPCNRRPP